MEKEYDVFSIGHILIDYITKADEELFKEFRLEKNIQNKRDIRTLRRIESRLKGIKKYPGSSSLNVIHGIANLGLKSALSGALAKDKNGKIFIDDLNMSGVTNCVVYKKGFTGIALNLVTSDGERTFVVNYGVADSYKPRDINEEILAKSKYFHFTGYEFESISKTIKKAVSLSEKYGTKISFDMGDPKIVLENKKEFKQFLEKAEIVFANKEEAKNFTGESNPGKALEKLAEYCKIAVVKLGKKGALVQKGRNAYQMKGYKVSLINTIGAGDGFAAGFLYGICKGHDLRYCCKLGNFYASRIVQETGARLSYEIPNLGLMLYLFDKNIT